MDMPHTGVNTTPVYNISSAVDTVLRLLYEQKPTETAHITDKTPKLTERNNKIRELHYEGYNFEEIAKMFGISPQRVHQIVNHRRK